MTVINSMSSARQVTFKGQNEQYHPFPAAVNFAAPGVGDFMKSENKTAVKRIAVETGLIALTAASIKGGLMAAKAEKGKLVVASIIGAGISGLGLAINHIKAGIDAYKPKKTEQVAK